MHHLDKIAIKLTVYFSIRNWLKLGYFSNFQLKLIIITYNFNWELPQKLKLIHTKKSKIESQIPLILSAKYGQKIGLA